MKSVTKTILNESEIKNIALHNFGAEPEVITELKGGLFNAAYIIRIGNKDMVIKTGPRATAHTLTYEKDIMKTEVKVNGLLKTAGVPVAGIIAQDFSRTVAPCDYFIMDFIGGKTWHKTDKKVLKANKSALMNDFGKNCGKTHSVRGEWFGYIKDDKRYQFDNWYAAFSAMTRAILHDGQALKCKLPYDEILDTVEKNKKYLEDVPEPRLVNFDMWAGNIFLNGQRITAIVDLERAFYGDPYAEFIACMFVFKDVEKESDFIAGYESVTGKKLVVGESERRRMTLYLLYLNIIMHVETYRYGKVYAALVKMYTKGQIKKLIKLLSR